jgi:hypothetical protein
MTDESNIFEALSHFNVSQENYLTESFVFLLKFLLLRAPDLGLAILNQLCGQQVIFEAEDIAGLEITTQLKDKADQPDIWIRTPKQDKLVYVEVKHDAPLGSKQLERYRDSLGKSGYKDTGLVLLARSRVSANDTTLRLNEDYRLMCWYQVYNWLSRNDRQDAVCDYLIQNFLFFLERKGMSVQKVSSDYVSGILAMNNLMEMLKPAIGEAIPGARPKLQYSWVSRGFFVGNSYCGIRFEVPHLLAFESYKDKSLVFKRDLNLTNENFFALNKDEQFERIVQFLREAYTISLKSNL